MRLVVSYIKIPKRKLFYSPNACKARRIVALKNYLVI